jgi:hypothetical protein
VLLLHAAAGFEAAMEAHEVREMPLASACSKLA